MPYTRWDSIRPANQARIGIRTKGRGGDLSASERAQVEASVTKARRIIPGVHAEVIAASVNRARPFTNRMLEVVFLDPDADQLLEIAATLVLINNGINLSQRLKVRNIPEVGGHDDGTRAVNAYGYVRPTRSGNHYGRIHIHRGLLVADQADLAFVTYVHEASHKYALTLDSPGGQWDDSGEAAGYKPNGVLTTEGAVVNADSYGWFCLLMSEGLRL